MAYGFSERGDVVRATIDGVDLSASGNLFQELERARQLLNDARDSLRAFLSFGVYAPADAVAQIVSGDEFEDASEYGTPRSVSSRPEVLYLGYNHKWRDLATRFTWEFLLEATADQIVDAANAVYAADNTQVFNAIMGSVLNNTTRITPESAVAYPLFNGDGTVPPPTMDDTFTGSHNHYLVSGAATVDGQDLVDLMQHVTHHGYGADVNTGRLLIFVNPNEAEVIRGFRVADGSPYDFIASETAPAFLTQETVVGDIPPGRLGRIPIIGGFGPAWVSESSFIPPGYMLAVASAGENSMLNPVGFREHARRDKRGLLRFGGNPDYPLQEAIYTRGFGTGVRHRGAAAVMEIRNDTADPGPYRVPVRYELVIA